jgi:hypothetical protein
MCCDCPTCVKRCSLAGEVAKLKFKDYMNFLKNTDKKSVMWIPCSLYNDGSVSSCEEPMAKNFFKNLREIVRHEKTIFTTFVSIAAKVDAIDFEGNRYYGIDHLSIKDCNFGEWHEPMSECIKDVIFPNQDWDELRTVFVRGEKRRDRMLAWINDEVDASELD